MTLVTLPTTLLLTKTLGLIIYDATSKYIAHTTLLSFHRKRMTKSEYKVLMKIEMIENYRHFYSATCYQECII